MLDRFRRLSKSKVGTGILAAFGVAILGSFALADWNSFGTSGFGMNSDTLVKVGSRQVSDQDVTLALQQVLTRARQQNPNATYQDLAPEFDPMVNSLVQLQALSAFGDDNGFVLSKRLVDAEIAKIPRTRGLDGKFSEAAYQSFLASERMTDPELRKLLSGSLVQRLLLAPVAANARIATGLSAPYANMLMEQREGELALISTAAFAAGLKPTDAEIASFYAANKSRYMVAEQRTLRIARFGPTDAGAASAPTEQEIAAYYKANQATYAPKETRVISQAVVPDAKVAAEIATRAKGGASFVAAAQPAGLSAADVSVGPQTQAEFATLASAKIAAAAFAPSVAAGTVVGPLQSDLGWNVIHIDSIKREPGKTLDQGRAEIVTKLAAEKGKTALATLVDQVQDGIDAGESFADVAAKAKLSVTETPLLTAQGTAPADPAFKLPADLSGALKSGFDLTGQDAPVVETLPNNQGFALVGLGRVVPAAPAPLDRIRSSVISDWIAQQATAKARATAAAIAASASKGAPLAEAVKTVGMPLPAPQKITARRIDMDQAPPAAQAALKMLFSLSPGQTRMVAAPGANGFAIVRVEKITPGNAMLQPTLIARVQSQFQEGASDEYARQFLNAVTAKVGTRRNDEAIAAAKQRMVGAQSAAE